MMGAEFKCLDFAAWWSVLVICAVLVPFMGSQKSEYIHISRLCTIQLNVAALVLEESILLVTFSACVSTNNEMAI